MKMRCLEGKIMSLIVEHYECREEWLRGRTRGIGASSAASAIGQNPYQTNLELWELMTGRRKPKEIIGNEAIDFGVKAEPVVRELFKLNHPEIKIEYHQFDILSQSEHPFIRCTLDGQATTDSPLRFGATKGILECKTATPRTKQDWEKWNGKIPQNYYIQVLHQLLATGWDYVWLAALLRGQQEIVYREYYFDRIDREDDMEDLLKREIDFWGYVERDEAPGEILPVI